MPAVSNYQFSVISYQLRIFQFTNPSPLIPYIFHISLKKLLTRLNKRVKLAIAPSTGYYLACIMYG